MTTGMKCRFVGIERRFVKFLRRPLVPKRRIPTEVLCFHDFRRGVLSGVTMVLLFLFVCPNHVSAQKNNPLDFDVCAEEVSDEAKERFDKAFSAYRKGDYAKSTGILKTLTEEEPDFASPYFLLGIIGVSTDRPKMIEKYMNEVARLCPQYSHPLFHYHLGVVEYSNEHYAVAVAHFEQFLNLSEEEEIYSDLQTEAINYIQWCEFLADATEKHFPFTPKKIEWVSSKNDERYPCISLDGKQIYFERKVAIRQNNDDGFYKKTEFVTKRVLCLAEMNEEGEFDEGFPLEEAFAKEGIVGRVSMTCDKRFMYFAKPSQERAYETDIFYCEKTDGHWSEARKLGNAVNGKGSNELSPCISPDGNTLYFASNREGGFGGYDIYISRKDKNGNWSQAVNAGRRINSPGDETNPFIHADNHNLYFSSDGWKTIGGKDLFHLDLEDIKMKQPQNLRSDINTEGDETEIYLLADGKTAYASVFDSTERNYNICTYPLPSEAWAESVRILEGRVDVADSEEKHCRIKVYAIGHKTETGYETNPANGAFTLALVDGEDYLLKIEKEGYAYCSRYITAKDTEKRMELTLLQMQTGESYPLNDVSLNEKNQPTEESREILKDFTEYLKANPRLRIEISAPAGQAAMITNYLMKSGIREDRLKASAQESEEVMYRLQ